MPRRSTAAGPIAARSSRAARDADPVDSQRQVLRQFRVIFNAVKSHFQQVENRTGATGAQIWALHVVGETPGIGVSQLARAMDIRQPTASTFAKALADRGLIEIRREGSDRRAVQLHVLPAGRRALREAPGPFNGVLPEALAAVDPATLVRLQADLAQVIRQLGADDRLGTMPLSGAQ
jgi:DNA-binding MarR family transcriptional regulator